MTVRLKHRSPEAEADQIANENLKPMMEEILRNVGGKMRASGKPLNRQDLEVAYSEGWQNVTEHIIQQRPVTSLAGLLYRMVHRRAIDLYRAKHDARRVDMDLEQQGVEPDFAEQIDDQEKLTRLLGRLAETLNEKERRALTLCALHGYRRPEAADLLGIDRVVFERIMDGATKKMGRVVASIEARGCGSDEWSRLMRAYALGLLTEDEPDYVRVLRHLDGDEPCEPCRRYVRGLRGLAAVLPPVLPPGLLAGHEAGHVLAHLSRWLGGGHATALRGAAAGAAGTGGGTAVGGVAVGGGALGGVAKTLVLAGAAALSVAGAAAVVATHHATGSHGRSPAHSRPAPAASTDTSLLAPDGFTDSLGVGLASSTHQRPAVRRHGHMAEFARVRHQPARETRKPEFSWQRPPGDRAQQYTSQSATTASATTPAAPAPPPAPHHSGSSSEGSNEPMANFIFETRH